MKTLLGFLLCVAAAHAGTVTISSDSGPGSLRQVLADASNGEIIQFAVSEVNLTSGQLTITKSVMLSGAVVVSRQSALRFRIFEITPSHNVTLRGLTISNGYADASFGAGIFNQGVLTLISCTVTENFADAGDGGGGIYSVGELTVLSSTISFNRAGFTSGAPLGYGGGIRSGGILTLINSTVSGNVADIDGGGINCYGLTTIHHSTIADNRAPGSGGGIYNGGHLQIAGTIIKTGLGASVFNTSDTGRVNSAGYNLASDDANGLLAGMGDMLQVDPLIGPLANNGGPTFTHRLLVGSPAINAGQPPFGFFPMSDQCGNPRISGNRIDIGSFETSQQLRNRKRSRAVTMTAHDSL